jgi:hypothetical protein
MIAQIFVIGRGKLLRMGFLAALCVSSLVLGFWFVSILGGGGRNWPETIGLVFLVLLGPTTWTVFISAVFLGARKRISNLLQVLTIGAAFWAVSISYISVSQ